MKVRLLRPPRAWFSTWIFFGSKYLATRSPQPRSPLPGLWTVESPTMNRIGKVRFVSVTKPWLAVTSRLASRLAESWGEIAEAVWSATAEIMKRTNLVIGFELSVTIQYD